MMSDSIEHDYAPICDLYERHLGPALFEPYAIDLAKGVADCAEGSVLEMAYGTGIVTRQLRAHLKPTAALTATDINARHARLRAKETERRGENYLEAGGHRESAVPRRFVQRGRLSVWTHIRAG